MNAKTRHNAFTFIEVLIVVIIVALLAATIIPQFSASTTDAKNNLLNFNMRTMNSLLQMYHAQHNGKYPTLARFTDQMTKRTNVDGGTDSGDLTYGPYIQGPVPANPYNGKNSIKAVSGIPTSGDGVEGWQYDASTGTIYPNNTEFDYTKLQP
jgi:general secretion pathway protein G